MRIAIIDLGTNTFNLIIAEINDGYKVILNKKTAVKLGEGGIEQNLITDKAFERAFQALLSFKSICDDHQVNKINAIGTSAIRNAINRDYFTQRIYEETNIFVQVINGEREAELIYKGVSMGVNLLDEPSLIMDIGGGSTEFIIANKSEIFWKRSFEIGAARLIERFKPTNPILATEIGEMEANLNSILFETIAMCNKYSVKELIGSSGSFDTFAEVIQFRLNQPIDLEIETEYTFEMSEFNSVYEFLLGSTYNERMNTKGIIPIRAEMIVVSGILTNFIIKKCSISKMRLSTYALKEGVLSEFI
jgi:exopolyphosphatase / guanosine-5'-triphosphate,3'-diphosphate pyrophosphatase